MAKSTQKRKMSTKKHLSLLLWLAACSTVEAAGPDADCGDTAALEVGNRSWACRCVEEEEKRSVKCRLPDDLLRLDADAVEMPPLARSLDLSRNRIEQIRGDVRWPIQLESLDLSHNALVEVSAAALSSLPTTLESLVLSHNRLAGLPEDAVLPPSLRTLDLSDNQLAGIGWLESAAGATALARLDLSGNRVLGAREQPIYSGDLTFGALPNLRFLDLSDCSISFLPLDAFEKNTELKELRLSRNPLKVVPLTQLYPLGDTLEFLDLTETDVEAIPNHAFHGLRSVRTLVLDSLPLLTEVEALAFNGLDSLDTLRMTGCPKLVYIDPYAFYDSFEQDRPNNVSRVYLSDNGLRFLSSSLLYWEDVEEVRLHGNPWRCDCDLAWTSDVARLNPALTWSNLTTCRDPARLKGTPLNRLLWRDFDCQRENSYSWMSLALVISTVLIVLSFATYLTCAWREQKIATTEAAARRRRSRRRGNGAAPAPANGRSAPPPPPPGYGGWKRVAGLFGRDNFRGGYDRVFRTGQAADRFQVLDNESELGSSNSIQMVRRGEESAGVAAPPQ